MLKARCVCAVDKRLFTLSNESIGANVWCITPTLHPRSGDLELSLSR